jgi:hypothetical protein
MSMFGSDAPQEDPAIKRQRELQQQAADAGLTASMQTDLRRRMRARLQRFGFAPNNPQADLPASSAASRPAMPRMRAFDLITGRGRS